MNAGAFKGSLYTYVIQPSAQVPPIHSIKAGCNEGLHLSGKRAQGDTFLALGFCQLLNEAAELRTMHI